MSREKKIQSREIKSGQKQIQSKKINRIPKKLIEGNKQKKMNGKNVE